MQLGIKATVRGLLVLLMTVLAAAGWFVLKADRADGRSAGMARAKQDLTEELAARGLKLGAPVFMRIFKEPAELEVWLWRAAEARWILVKTYDICNHSGDLGPKLKEGDRQSPEGIYEVRREQLHPTSRYHLAFNLGFPNAFDRANGRSGSYLMVHGDCVSVGCYAMTDPAIEEIYVLAEAALDGGQAAFQVQALPARLSEPWMADHAASPWIGFWRDLKVCSDIFQETGQVPRSSVQDKRYRCSPAG